MQVEWKRMPADHPMVLSSQGRQWWYAVEIGPWSEDRWMAISDLRMDRQGKDWVLSFLLPFVLPIKGAR